MDGKHEWEIGPESLDAQSNLIADISCPCGSIMLRVPESAFVVAVDVMGDEDHDTNMAKIEEAEADTLHGQFVALEKALKELEIEIYRALAPFTFLGWVLSKLNKLFKK